MKKNNRIKICLLTSFIALFASGCSRSPVAFETIETLPEIYPDYTNLKIPVNIAPLNFAVTDAERIIANYSANGKFFSVKGKNRIEIPQKKWKSFLKQNIGDTIWVEIYVKKARQWKVYTKTWYFISPDAIDPYIVYRYIPPGYDQWNRMGLFQRNLESFKEKPIITNEYTKKNCMNCHSFRMNDPNEMVFHFRQKFAGTYLLKDNVLSRLDTKTEYTISNCVYPYWHPSGNFIAFSNNLTSQSLHACPRLNIEVYDEASDIVILDIESNKLFTDSLISKPDILETYPSFSPDGKKLFFSASQVQEKLPDEYHLIKYSLYSIDFDPYTKRFGTKIDTLISSCIVNKSVTFAHPSPDGKFILCTLSDYGCFPSWNEESDLYLLDLSNGNLKNLKTVNSTSAEGFTSWSSNSKWITFSSRREDGQYNRLYFAYIDTAGNPSKPFILPQKNPQHNIMNLNAYNKPEFAKAKINIKPQKIVKVAKNESIKVGFSGEAIKVRNVRQSRQNEVN